MTIQLNPSIQKEAVLERLLRQQRINQVLPYIKSYPNCHLLDIGCGWEARLLKDLAPYIQKGVGIDFKAPEIQSDRIQTFTTHIDKRLPFEDDSFEVVTMLAVLEHLQHPLDVLKECERILKPSGALILTVPSHYAKPVLEFLAFRVGIVSKEEILDHKNYFDRTDLEKLFNCLDHLRLQHHTYFQWKFNNRVIAIKH